MVVGRLTRGLPWFCRALRCGIASGAMAGALVRGEADLLDVLGGDRHSFPFEPAGYVEACTFPGATGIVAVTSICAKSTKISDTSRRRMTGSEPEPGQTDSGERELLEDGAFLITAFETPQRRDQNPSPSPLDRRSALRWGVASFSNGR